MNEARHVENSWIKQINSTLIYEVDTVDTPEKALMSALLFDGIQNFLSYVHAHTPSAKRRYQESYQWVRKEDTKYIFSFDNVCQSLGINAQYLRLGLINICNSPKEDWKRLRRVG